MPPLFFEVTGIYVGLLSIGINLLLRHRHEDLLAQTHLAGKVFVPLVFLVLNAEIHGCIKKVAHMSLNAFDSVLVNLQGLSVPAQHCAGS